MSRATVKRIAGFIPATCFAALLAGGCASSGARTPVSAPGPGLAAAPPEPAAMNVPGVRRTASAVDGLRDMAQELGSVRQTVGDTLVALAELTAAQGDLLAPFARFMSLNAQLEDADRRLADRGDEMRTRARDYITNWEVEVYGVEDPELRAQAETRRSQVRADYGKISDATRALRESMDPFRRQLADVQTFLANDLTHRGVQSASPAVARVRTAGEALQGRIDALAGEVERVAATMAPAVGSGGTAAPNSVR